MIYSEKIQKAIRIASHAHKGQVRKVSGLPFMLHPLSVAFILKEVDASEDSIIAGILHDTVEDTDLTLAEIKTQFGEDVTRIVSDLTEPDKSVPWEQRKKTALDHIKDMQQDSLLVKSADVLHNLSDQIYDFNELGDELFKKFGASKEQQIERYQKVLNELEKAWSENPLVPILKERVTFAQQNWM